MLTNGSTASITDIKPWNPYSRVQFVEELSLGASACTMNDQECMILEAHNNDANVLLIRTSVDGDPDLQNRVFFIPWRKRDGVLANLITADSPLSELPLREWQLVNGGPDNIGPIALLSESQQALVEGTSLQDLNPDILGLETLLWHLGEDFQRDWAVTNWITDRLVH